jgi:hypothetical protein
VWSPAGGWFPDPYHWRRNTAIALGAIGLACVPVFLASAKKEVNELLLGKITSNEQKIIQEHEAIALVLIICNHRCSRALPGELQRRHLARVTAVPTSREFPQKQ